MRIEHMFHLACRALPPLVHTRSTSLANEPRRPAQIGIDARRWVLGMAVDECQAHLMSRPEGFEWQRRSNGDIAVFHHGRLATTLRGRRAQAFMEDVQSGDDQELMARLTRNYKRGNERHARQHPRNRTRR